MKKYIIYSAILLASAGLTLISCNSKQTIIQTFTADGAWCWFQDPRAVYVKGEHERTYAQWMTEDGGTTWASTPTTQDSDKLNARPVVPHGYSGKNDYVLWMSGHYIHYTKYNTAIQMHIQR